MNTYEKILYYFLLFIVTPIITRLIIVACKKDKADIIDKCRKTKPKEMSLISACKSGDFDEAKSLIEEGANVNFKFPYDKKTPLIFACENSHYDIVKLLIEKGANVNNTYNIPFNRDANNLFGDNFTALMTICRMRNLEIAKLLLENGAKVNLKNSNGRTALSMTYKPELVELLKSYGAKE